MARLVMVKGDGPAWLIDLDKNPQIEQRIEAGELVVIRELDELPPDPWAEQPKKRGKVADVKPETEPPTPVPALAEEQTEQP